jgi:hypothetical protein
MLEINIIVAYKSPQYSKPLCMKTMGDTLRTIDGHVAVLGDFNMDLRKSDGRKVVDLFNSQQLESKLNVDSSSTDGGF